MLFLGMGGADILSSCSTCQFGRVPSPEQIGIVECVWSGDCEFYPKSWGVPAPSNCIVGSGLQPSEPGIGGGGLLLGGKGVLLAIPQASASTAWVVS